jgi:hypothetical protein
VGPLWEQLEAEAPWLFNELGFKTVYSHYDWQHMGDSIAILQIEELLLRFVRDRGQYSADIAHPSEPKHWWTLFEVHRLIEGVQPKEPLELAAAAELLTLAKVLATLRMDFAEILDRFKVRWAETQRELDNRRLVH